MILKSNGSHRELHKDLYVTEPGFHIPICCLVSSLFQLIVGGSSMELWYALSCFMQVMGDLFISLSLFPRLCKCVCTWTILDIIENKKHLAPLRNENPVPQLSCVYTGNRSAQYMWLIYNKTKYFTNPYRQVAAVWTNCLPLDKNYRYTLMLDTGSARCNISLISFSKRRK
jgi:hypothetical protein